MIASHRTVRLTATWWLAPLASLVTCTLPAAEETQSLDRISVTAESDEPVVYAAHSSSSATGLDLSLRDTPQSVTVVTRQRLDDQHLESLRDVLDTTPGIYSYEWDSERVSFTSRGFVIDNLMVDGVSATTNFSTDSVDDTLDTSFYDRIEIVRGATGLMTGAGSPAASVNLVRKHATSTALTGDLQLTGASWNDRRLEGDISLPLTQDGRVRARVVGAYQERDSYQALYRNRKQAFYGVIDADLSPSMLLSVGYDYQDNLPRSNTWGSYPLFLADGTAADWARSVTTAPDWSFWDRRKQSAFAELQKNFANGWSLHSSLTWRRSNENLALFYVYGFPDPLTGDGLLPYAYRSTSAITERAATVMASGPVELFGRQHQILFGYTGSWVDNSALEYPHGALADPGDFYRWDGSYPEPAFSATGIRLTDVDSRQHGVYATGRFALTDSFKAIAGARYSTWKTDYFYLYDSPDAGFHFDYRRIIPYAGAIFDLSRNFSAFASYTEIFKPQSSRDASGKYLDPIDGRSVEFGIKGEHFDGRLNSALTLFQTRQNNVAAPAFDPVTGAPVLLGDGTQASQAIAGARTRGFELELAGELRRGWNASLGWSRYLLQDADGNPVRTFVPRTLIRTFTTWHPAAMGDRLTVGGGVNWQSASSTPVGTPTGSATLQQGAVTLVSLMARYQWTPNFSVQANGSNLLDRKYYVLDEYGNTSFGVPSSGSLSVTWKF